MHTKLGEQLENLKTCENARKENFTALSVYFLLTQFVSISLHLQLFLFIIKTIYKL